MVWLPIDFISHPKIPVSLRSETSETGGSVSLFREKKFRYVSLQFCFEAKFGDTLLVTRARCTSKLAGSRIGVKLVSRPQSPLTSPLSTRHNCVISSEEHEFSVPILSRSAFLYKICVPVHPHS